MFPGTRMSSLMSGIDFLRARRAVAVDDEARIVLLHQGGVERVRHQAGRRGDADVPGDVALAFRFRNSEPAQ